MLLLPLSLYSYFRTYIQLFKLYLVHYHAWRKRGGRADAVVDGASQCIHTYMHGCKPGNLLTCTPCQQLMSGKRKTVHCPCEPTTLWLIASSVVMKLASVRTEGCSVACDVIFAAAVVRQSRYDNLSRCISYRFGDLDLQSGRGQGRMGKEGMGCNWVYEARIRHVALRLLYTTTQHEWQQRCSFLSAQPNVCYMSDISMYAKGRRSQEV